MSVYARSERSYRGEESILGRQQDIFFNATVRGRQEAVYDEKMAVLDG